MSDRCDGICVTGGPGIMDENQVMARPFSPTVVSSRPTIAAAVMRVKHFVVRDACERRVRAACGTRAGGGRGCAQWTWRKAHLCDCLRLFSVAHKSTACAPSSQQFVRTKQQFLVTVRKDWPRRSSAMPGRCGRRTPRCVRRDRMSCAASSAGQHRGARTEAWPPWWLRYAPQ